jgi:AraC-like DNA-binding protein
MLDRSSATVSVTLLLPFLRLLDEQDEPLREAAFDFGERLLARWGVTRAELETDPRKRLPFGLMVEMLTGFVGILGDPSAPLKAGMLLEEGDYELIECLASTCDTLGDAIQCVGKYYALLGPAELELHVEGDRAEARFRVMPGLNVPDSVNEFAMASNFAMSILHIELLDVEMPLEVRFTHAAPAHADVFPQIFFVPVRFNCEHNAIVFSERLVRQPMRHKNPVMHSVLLRLANLELDALIDKSAFPMRVRDAIVTELPSGAPLESVAERLHMSPSTLRSRLTKSGTSYSALLDDLRRDTAKRELRRGERSIAEVGHSLGFAHPPAFHRAVRRWFGVTPRAFREAPGEHPVSRFWRKRS